MSMYSSGIAELFAVGVTSFLLGYGFPRAEWLKMWQERLLKWAHDYFVREKK